jgi:hypothetical protein
LDLLRLVRIIVSSQGTIHTLLSCSGSESATRGSMLSRVERSCVVGLCVAVSVIIIVTPERFRLDDHRITRHQVRETRVQTRTCRFRVVRCERNPSLAVDSNGDRDGAMDTHTSLRTEVLSSQHLVVLPANLRIGRTKGGPAPPAFDRTDQNPIWGRGVKSSRMDIAMNCLVSYAGDPPKVIRRLPPGWMIGPHVTHSTSDTLCTIPKTSFAIPAEPIDEGAAQETPPDPPALRARLN